MEKYTFLHDLELMKKFKPRDDIRNACMMHDVVTLWEDPIFEAIQISFDLHRLDCLKKFRYAIKDDGMIYPETWSLLSVDSRWNDESFEKGAQFLANHLNYLPEYIIDATYTILAECLGFKVFNKGFIFAKDEAEEKEFRELGKYHLSILMRMIMELGKLGIDCRAICISTRPFYTRAIVEDCLTPQIVNSLKMEEMFHIREDDIRRGYERYYAVKDKVYRTICVHNLEEFLDTLLRCIDIVCTYNDTMIAPDKIDFSNFYYPNEALPNSYGLPVGELTNAEECISDFLEKLKKGAFIEQYYDIKSGKALEDAEKVEDLKEGEKVEALTVHSNMTVVPTLLKSFIDYLLAKNYVYPDQKNNSLMVVKSTSLEEPWLVAHAYYKDTHGFAADLNDYSAMAQINFLAVIFNQIQNININYTYTSENPSDEIKEDLYAELMKRIQRLEDRQDTLEEQVDTLRSDVDILKEQIAAYLETGKNIPAFNKADRFKVIKVVHDCKTASFGAWARKMLLMGALVVGATAILNASAARNPEVVQSTPDGTIPTENYEGVEIHKRPIYPHAWFEGDDAPVESLPVAEEKLSMHMFEMVDGTRDYYESSRDKDALGITDQKGTIIRYFAFQNGVFVGSFGTEQALQEFVSTHDIKEYTWRAAVCCLDYNLLSKYIESDTAISLEYTTFYTDYSPNVELVQKRQMP